MWVGYVANPKKLSNGEIINTRLQVTAKHTFALMHIRVQLFQTRITTTIITIMAIRKVIMLLASGTIG